MDRRNNKISMLANLQTAGYSIEFGNTTFSNTLEERIQAAKEASSAAQAQKSKTETMTKRLYNNMPKANKQGPSIRPNFIPQIPTNSFINTSTNLPFNYNSASLKSTCKGGGPIQRRFMPVSDNPTNAFINTNTNLPFNSNSTSLKSTCKGGGPMQRRLEEIKAKKKLSNISSHELNTSSTLESTKISNCVSKNVSTQTIIKSNHSNNANCSKYISTDKNKHLDTKIEYKNSAKNIVQHYPNNSVQNRLIKAKEEMKAKSNFSKQNYTPKSEPLPVPVSERMNHQEKNMLGKNIKNKTKRLSSSNETTKRKTPISTVQKLKLNKSNVNTIVDNKELVMVQKIPTIPNCIISSSPPETAVTSKLKNVDILKKAREKELLDSFSFVVPKTFSVQQRLENKKKDPNNYLNYQSNNDDSMEWEDVEPNNIVNTVNDLRKTSHEYECDNEPMEWIPDTVTLCDEINHCLVVDTNILLLDLKSIAVAIDRFFPDFGYLTFVLPWQVCQELDCIKKQDNQLGFRAREATRWMLNIISKKHPRLKGQPMTIKKGESNDDAILMCAISLKDRVQHVSLLTDDQLLTVKSEFSEVPVKNSKWLKNLISFNSLSESNVFREAVKTYPIMNYPLIMEFKPHLENVIAKVLKFAMGQNTNHNNLKEIASWNIDLSTQHNIIILLMELKEHWNTIVPDKVFTGFQNKLDWLLNFFNDFQNTSLGICIIWSDLYDFLKYSTEILDSLPYEYDHITSIILNDLMKAKRYLKKRLDLPSLDKSLQIIPQLNDLNVSYSENICDVDNILLNILNEAKEFCSYVYSVNGFHQNSAEKKPSDLLPNPIDLKNKIDNYCYVLSQLIKVMSRIKMYETEQILESNLIIEEFLKTIADFNKEKNCELQKENIVNYCLMKDKNMFLKILVNLKNYLAAVQNLVTIIKP